MPQYDAGAHWGLRGSAKEVFASFLILVLAIRMNQLFRAKGPAIYLAQPNGLG